MSPGLYFRLGSMHACSSFSTLVLYSTAALSSWYQLSTSQYPCIYSHPCMHPYICMHTHFFPKKSTTPAQRARPLPMNGLSNSFLVGLPPSLLCCLGPTLLIWANITGSFSVHGVWMWMHVNRRERGGKVTVHKRKWARGERKRKRIAAAI